MKKVELKDETWYEFSEGCRYHSDSQRGYDTHHIKHKCWKPGSIMHCHPMYCQRINIKKAERLKELKELFDNG